MSPSEPRIVEVAREDAAVLAGLLAIVETLVLADGLPTSIQAKIAARLQHAGLLHAGAGERELRQALYDLNNRLRYALGEYDQPTTGPVVPRD